jgi:hypothetical protein
MRALANELGVSGATLYRRTGHREQLISDVARMHSDAGFEQAKPPPPTSQGRGRLRSAGPSNGSGLSDTSGILDDV